ncbi:hypothetical protein Dip510_001112 [Elusimicrobium posterum]|uniref:hypothetical protein n=1 Tax=Elusimicrobium posterum TaxID=3116653 RepID=UPI003C722D95
MKKNSRTLTAAALIFAGSMALSACGSDLTEIYVQYKKQQEMTAMMRAPQKPQTHKSLQKGGVTVLGKEDMAKIRKSSAQIQQNNERILENLRVNYGDKAEADAEIILAEFDQEMVELSFTASSAEDFKKKTEEAWLKYVPRLSQITKKYKKKN